MEFLNTSLNIVRESGEMLIDGIKSSFNVDRKESKFDLVTEWDKKIESFITEKIQDAFPNHKIIGEESIYSEGSQSFEELLRSEPHLWVLDPIDGTNNYIHRLPGYTISLAMISYGEIKLGIIYNPDNDEMFCAEYGKGAFLNGERLHVSDRSVLAESMLATGFPADVDVDRKAVLNQINELGPLCRNIRVFGSAALHCAYVAAGRLEAYWEPGLNIWDIAAGALIVQEANGSVSEMDGSPFILDFKSFMCGNGVMDNVIIHHLNKVASKEMG
ncbi:inositol monophosphatase family protein [Lentibacillus salinarum]|uniref:Inositol-1-monophosphatase n=1 Tax=Lentibacillus salinarum TaxID=446820 RepID=A0ABW3ZW09_9BACI